MNCPIPLDVEEMFHPCSEDDLNVTTSAEFETTELIVGQKRAIQAINFAVSMEGNGHNLFVVGPAGTGRRTLVQRALDKAAKAKSTPSDWCYVNNFEEPQCPTALELPAGKANAFASEMNKFISEVRTSLVATFQGEDYQKRHHALETEFREQQSKTMEQVHDAAKRANIRVMQTPTGMMFAPLKEGEAIGPEEFSELPEQEQKRFQKDVDELSKMLQESMAEMPQRLRKLRIQIAELDKEVTRFAVGSLIAELMQEYAEFPGVTSYLSSVEKDLIKNPTLFRDDSMEETPLVEAVLEDYSSGRYGVNVIVSREPNSAAPVIVEDHPAYQQLIGRVENRAEMGTLTTDFSLIRNGALHRANGGFLILDARRLLMEPFAWEGLKRALKSGVIKIESLAEAYALTTTVALQPESIPLDVKVVIVGDRNLYFLLQTFDSEFKDLFKVTADFDDSTERTKETQLEFAVMLAAIVKNHSLPPLSRCAMYRVIEEAARYAGDREKLSTEIRRSEDLIREGHYWSKENGHPIITADDIDEAITSREYRHGRIRERVVEEITRGNILIDTEGEKVGQINALAVYQLDDFSFGRPSRVTARVSLGNGKVIDIERESDLGGPLHSKGVLILSGYIAANYAEQLPLSLAATVAFEQSYGGIDGDSASSAELYALLSAIGNLPISQSIAVTGSVNQFGEVQAIGGVNEKIEGFFDVCAARGLTGKQGVMIPRANVKHLMLRQRVLSAVRSGKFKVYPVDNIDEGLILLTGKDLGTRNTDGVYPKDSINACIREALKTLADQRRAFSSHNNVKDKS